MKLNQAPGDRGTKCTTMDIKQKLEELQAVIDKGVTPEAYAMITEINEKASTDEDRDAIDKFISSNIAKLSDDINDLHDETLKLQLGSIGDMINLSYMARTYFKKSRAWLSQRINGNEVNGKPARFTEAELDTFNRALADMSRIIGSTRLSY